MKRLLLLVLTLAIVGCTAYPDTVTEPIEEVLMDNRTIADKVQDEPLEPTSIPESITPEPIQSPDSTLEPTPIPTKEPTPASETTPSPKSTPKPTLVPTPEPTPGVTLEPTSEITPEPTPQGPDLNFVWPVPGEYSYIPYGTKTHNSLVTSIKIPITQNTPVVAVSSGEVISGGEVISIRISDDIVVQYHRTRSKVRTGDLVKKGDVIATAYRGFFALQVRNNKGLVDPMDYITEKNDYIVIPTTTPEPEATDEPEAEPTESPVPEEPQETEDPTD